MIAQHSSKTSEHFTPPAVVEAARRVLGGIDLDPASCAEANATVGAFQFFASPADGLLKRWSGRVFLNPPGGTLTLSKAARAELGAGKAKLESLRLAEEAAAWGTRSRPVAWWRKLSEQWRAGNVDAAIFLGFTLEILRTAQGDHRFDSPLDFPFCVLRSRQRFGGNSPTHGNVVIYLGDKPRAFEREFSPMGEVRL
jgi:hypothetical protein